jgi:F420-dependent oxidoreductase-like protein
MRTATTIEASSGKDAVEFAVEAERLGLDVCWVAEAWGADAPSPLGYLAARTERMLLGSGVIQIGTRSPVTIAQTAMTLAHLSGGRFLLGLGASGPQVMEGLHGVPFGHPLGRMRETVEIVRRVFTGEKVTYAGRHYELPLPGAKPMRVSLPPVSVPVYLATLSPKMLALTGEIADGWLGTSFIPERADAYFEHLDTGLARAGTGARARASLDVCQGAEISLVSEAELASTLASRKKELAFSLGGMGTATANFYNDAYSRQGWAEVAAEVRARWQAGDRDGAAALVTDEMVLATTLIGTEDMVRARLRAWRDAGVDTVRLYPAGDTLTARLDTLARGIDLVRAALPDPHLVDQRSVQRGILVAPNPGGDEYGEACVENRDIGCLVGNDAIGLGPQPPGRGGVGELRRLRLAGQRVDVRIAELGPVESAGLVSRLAAQHGAEERRRGGEVGAPSCETGLDLGAVVAEVGEELICGNCVQAGLVSQLIEEPDEVGAFRLIRGIVAAPNGHRHVHRAGFPDKQSRLIHVRAMPGPVPGADRGGAIALVARKVRWEHMARRGGLTGGELVELQGPLAIDGVADGLPRLDVRERRLAGVEREIIGAHFETGVDPGRVPDGE